MAARSEKVKILKSRMAVRHYLNPPITEAVLDLRVPAVPDIAADDLINMRVGEEAAYPTAQPLFAVMGKMVVGSELSTSATQQHTGFTFRRQDARYIYQARLNGFTISQLPRYTDWTDFRSEAARYWRRYQDLVRPTGVTRGGLRYVNRIDIPQGKDQERFEVDDYLRTGPKLAQDLPQTMQGFFVQIALQWPGTECRSTITETIIPPARPDVISLILDIDTFHEYRTPATDDQVWKCLDELHDLKNEAFEACITDKARELFK